MKDNYLSATGVLSVVLTGTLIGGANVAAAEEGASRAIEEVIVTAQRREESANDVGMGIQALTDEQLNRTRIRDVDDLVAMVPGFNVSQSYQGVPTYTLRGIGFNTINISATSTVGVYLDEVSRPYPILNAGPMFDVQRVEVLKGPQGTLFGRNTTAGLINLVSNKPTDEFEAGLVADVGTFGTTNLQGHISGALADNFQARLAFATEHSDEGWQESVSRDEENGEVDRTGIRLSLAAQPTDNLTIDFSYSYWTDESDPLAAQAIGFTPATTGSPFNAAGLANFVATNAPRNSEDADWAPYATRAVDIGIGTGVSKPLEKDLEFTGAKLRIEYDISDDMRLISLTGYNDLDRNGISDWSGAPYEVLVQDFEGEIESVSQELRIEGSTEKANWMIGVYYAKDELLDSNQTLLGDNANVATIRFLTGQIVSDPAYPGPFTLTDVAQTFRKFRDIGEFETNTKSLFANVDWLLTDELTLTTGIRFTQDEQEYAGCSRDVNGSMLPNVNTFNIGLYQLLFGTPSGTTVTPIGLNDCVTFDTRTASFGLVTSELDEDNTSWRVALNYTPGNDVLWYGSVSQGAKAGSTPVNAANIAEQNAAAEQEMLLAYEIGTKASLFDRVMQLNAAVFYYDYEDKQLSAFFADPIYTALSRLQNIPDSNAYGVDMDLTWRATENLTALFSATWLRTEVDGYQGINGAGLPQDYDGAEFLYSPRFTGNLTLLYDRPISSNLALQIALNGRHQSDSSASLQDDPLYEIDSYQVYNASIGLRSLDDKWDVMVWAQNLADEYYWTAVSSNANTIVRFPGKSRTAGLSLSYRF